jgi:surface polysaccharide O-acyltransferase-like enzyme
MKNRFSDRNYNIDSLKAACAFLIVCVHIQFPEPINSIVLPITRIAVPIFFMITGYFYNLNGNAVQKHNQIIHVLKLIVFANTFYLSFNTLFSVMQGKSGLDYIVSVLTIKKIALFLITNDDSVSGHLWYLSAILYVLIIFLLLPGLNKRGKYRYVVIVALLLCDIVFGKYAIVIWGHEFPLWMTRNFLFVGIPYFWIGNLIRENNDFKGKARTLGCLIMSALFCVTSIAESMILKLLNCNATRDHYISTTFLAITVFTLALQLRESKKLPALIGERYSQDIYIIHPAIITVFTVDFFGSVVADFYTWVAPLVVYVATIGVLCVGNCIKMFALNLKIE